MTEQQRRQVKRIRKALTSSLMDKGYTVKDEGKKLSIFKKGTELCKVDFEGNIEYLPDAISETEQSAVENEIVTIVREVFAMQK